MSEPDRTVQPLGDDTIPPEFEWLDKYTEENGYQEACLECQHYYVEHDVNFALCLVLDSRSDCIDQCSLVPDRFFEDKETPNDG